MTGESDSIEKMPLCNADEGSVVDLDNLAFMGSNVVSGTARGIVFATGNQTYLGSIAKSIAGHRAETAFDKGITKVSMLLIRFMLIMVPFVFMVNGFTKGDWLEAFIFAVSVAVGLTPEMLPMIVTANLAKESADIILLEKDLMVLEQGVLSGRETFGNIIKYVKMTASSNFGNMFSVLAASAFLPFLPMFSIHLLVQNLLYDISQTAIPFTSFGAYIGLMPLPLSYFPWLVAILLLIAIHVGSVNEAVTILEGCINRVETNIATKRVSTDAKRWQSHSLPNQSRV